MTRTGMRPVARETRAYFAPVDRVSGSPVVFDPSKDAGFLLDAPTAPWIDLGWVEDFRRTSTSQIESLAGGAANAVAAQARNALGARIDFEFRDWGKLQMALAGGAEHMNVLASDPNASRSGSGGIAVTAVALLAGSSNGELVLGVGAVDGFEVGDLVACDLDYAQQTGYVGSGIAAAYVKNPQDVRQDANYIRRVTVNVARVAEKTGTSLLVEQEESGGRVCFYYPRLSPCTAVTTWEREHKVEIEKPVAMLALRASFTALPTVDDNDSALVLCYRSYFPAGGAAVY